MSTTRKQNREIRVGASCADITPEWSVELSGYGTNRAEGHNLSTGVHDPIFVRCIVFQGGGRAVALIVIDTVGIRLETTRRLRSLVAQAIPVRPQDVLITCTHTHSAPGILWRRRYGRIDQRWRGRMVRRLVKAAAEAYERRRPARVGLGRALVRNVAASRRARLDDGSVFHYVGVSARQPPTGRSVVERGTIDPEMSVLVARDKDDRVLAFLVNYACHPWLYNGNKVSAEIAGACLAHVERALAREGHEATGLWTIGASSDIITLQNQRPMPSGIRRKEKWFDAEIERFGALLGEAALEAIGKARRYRRAGAVTSTLHPVRCPVYDVPLGAVLARHGRLSEPRRFRETELQIVRVGDVAFVGLPGEVYVEYGLDIKRRSRWRDTIVMSHCNDFFGDFITDCAVRERSCPELEWTRVHPDAGRAVMKALARPLFRRGG